MFKRTLAAVLAITMLVGLMQFGLTVAAPSASATAEARECWNENALGQDSVGAGIRCVNGARVNWSSDDQHRRCDSDDNRTLRGHRGTPADHPEYTRPVGYRGAHCCGEARWYQTCFLVQHSSRSGRIPSETVKA
jgi:hypothetical protein